MLSRVGKVDVSSRRFVGASDIETYRMRQEEEEGLAKKTEQRMTLKSS